MDTVQICANMYLLQFVQISVYTVHCTTVSAICVRKNQCVRTIVYNSQCLVCSEYEQYVQVRMFNKCMYSEETLDMVVYNLAADMRWRQYGVQICVNMCP